MHAKDVYLELLKAYNANKGQELRAVVLKALACKADRAEEYYDLADLLRRVDYFEGATLLYQKALELDPNFQKARHGLANLLQNMGLYEQSLGEYRQAYKKDPTDFTAIWGERLFLPTVYESTESMKAWRQRWRRNLKEMARSLSLNTPQEVERAFLAPFYHANFLLAYQGDDTLKDQQLFGELVTRIAESKYPPLPSKRVRKPGGKRRVGFLSAHFYSHSIYKSHGTWITHLDKSQFEIHTFYLGTIKDVSTKEIESHSDSFSSDFKNEAELIDSILKRDLDVLIYTDIGMFSLVELLAALRLAPVQCNTWGHPVTSGLKNIDFMLSSALMEPEHAQEQYSEKLVLLPNLSSCYAKPDIARTVHPRGLKEKDPHKVVYLNAQNLQKLLPEHDDLYPKLALKVPNAEFHFIGTYRFGASSIFFKRLERAFKACGLDAAHYCRFHLSMPQEMFFGLLQYADVVLDSLAWSGFNSTMEAIGFDKPVVTLPGNTCRSRHSYAILTMLGCPELIAKSKEEYIEIAASLSDPALRQRTVEKICKNKSRLFLDEAPIKALEDFLTRVSC